MKHTHITCNCSHFTDKNFIWFNSKSTQPIWDCLWSKKFKLTETKTLAGLFQYSCYTLNLLFVPSNLCFSFGWQLVVPVNPYTHSKHKFPLSINPLFKNNKDFALVSFWVHRTPSSLHSYFTFHFHCHSSKLVLIKFANILKGHAGWISSILLLCLYTIAIETDRGEGLSLVNQTLQPFR